jgi:hypothetical protein
METIFGVVGCFEQMGVSVRVRGGDKEQRIEAAKCVFNSGG